MSFPFFVAARYFVSRRKKNFINIISWLSMAGLAFSTAALIIVLSVFNGLGDLLRSLYTSFDPELKIEAVEGKTFPVNDSLRTVLAKVPGVKLFTEVIEDYAYVRYRDASMVVTVRGVSENFMDQHRLDNHFTEGKPLLRHDSIPFAFLGQGVRYTLSAEVTDDMYALQMYYIRNLRAGSLNMYTQKSIRPGAVFSIEKNIDENYIFVPISFAEELFASGDKRSYIEVKTDGNDIQQTQRLIQEAIGNTFNVLTNEEQHKDLFRLLKFEKLFVFIAMALLVVVGSINIFFSLMMLVIEKKKDISILTALGADASTIRRIFLHESAIISMIGAGTGLFIGAVLCLLQEHVGIVGMGLENALANNYPVRLAMTDFLWVGVLVVLISWLIALRPASIAARSYSANEL